MRNKLIFLRRLLFAGIMAILIVFSLHFYTHIIDISSNYETDIYYINMNKDLEIINKNYSEISGTLKCTGNRQELTIGDTLSCSFWIMNLGSAKYASSIFYLDYPKEGQFPKQGGPLDVSNEMSLLEPNKSTELTFKAHNPIEVGNIELRVELYILDKWNSGESTKNRIFYEVIPLEYVSDVRYTLDINQKEQRYIDFTIIQIMVLIALFSAWILVIAQIEIIKSRQEDKKLEQNERRKEDKLGKYKQQLSLLNTLSTELKVLGSNRQVQIGNLKLKLELESNLHWFKKLIRDKKAPKHSMWHIDVSKYLTQLINWFNNPLIPKLKDWLVLIDQKIELINRMREDLIARRVNLNTSERASSEFINGAVKLIDEAINYVKITQGEVNKLIKSIEKDMKKL